MQAYEYVQRVRADMRGTNLLGALSWLYQQPMQRSYPRQVFIITDGSISNVAKVLELVRRNTCAGRYQNHNQLFGHCTVKYNKITSRTAVRKTEGSVPGLQLLIGVCTVIFYFGDTNLFFLPSRFYNHERVFASVCPSSGGPTCPLWF